MKKMKMATVIRTIENAEKYNAIGREWAKRGDFQKAIEAKKKALSKILRMKKLLLEEKIIGDAYEEKNEGI